MTDEPPCGCNRAMMAALSPMHPLHYLELACDEHRRRYQESTTSPMIRDYQPHNQWRNL